MTSTSAPKMARVFALIVAIAAAGVLVMLPPRATTLPVSQDLPEPVRGAVHIHTQRSDGSGSVDDVAAAAARAGLHFIVLSDHGDATRPPQPPEYRHGVLCIDAVEVTTFAGHVLALGLAAEAPYPLGGEPRDVIEDITRMKGMSIAAHPTSGKAALRWREWQLPFDGLEWLNADSEWRDEKPLTLIRALITYPFRRSETLTKLLNRPSEVLARWDGLLSKRRVVAIPGADAHAALGFTGEDNPYGGGSLIALPSYEQSFKTFSVSLPGAHLSGDPVMDSRMVLSELRAGHVYSSVEGLAHPARLAFTATSGTATAREGETLPLAGAVHISVRTNAPQSAEIYLVRNGVIAASAAGGALDFDTAAEAAVFRVEVYLRGARADDVPWVLSNPIYVGDRSGATEKPFVAREQSMRYTDGVPLAEAGWGIEKDEKSLGVLDVIPGGRAGTRLLLRYRLGGAASDSPHVALGMPAGPDIAQFSHVAFTARANRPMRLWVQLWTTVPTGNQYWRRSVYLDEQMRDISIPFAEMTPVPRPAPRLAPLATIKSIMFVVDQVHTPIGADGQYWIDDVRYQR